MADVASFLRWVMPDVQGCPIPMASQAVVTTAMEFCEETKAWEYEHDPIYVFAGINDYEFTLPESSQIVEITDNCYSQGKRIYQKTRGWLTDNVVGWATKKQAEIEYLLVVDFTKLVTIPIPTANIKDGITNLSIVLKPTIDATTLPDWIYNQYGEIIGIGALAKLMDRPKTTIAPWGDVVTASVFRNKFNHEVAKVKDKTSLGMRNGIKRLRTTKHFSA